jgi:hypothetical protein
MTAFLGWLLTVLAKIGLDFWTHQPPAPVVVEAENVGAANANVATADQAVKTETAIAQAEADAPKTQAAVVDTLEKGEF